MIVINNPQTTIHYVFSFNYFFCHNKHLSKNIVTEFEKKVTLKVKVQDHTKVNTDLHNLKIKTHLNSVTLNKIFCRCLDRNKVRLVIIEAGNAVSGGV